MMGPRYFLFGPIKKFLPQNGEKNVMRNWISFLDDKNAHVQLHMSFIHVAFLHNFFFNIFFPLLAFFFPRRCLPFLLFSFFFGFTGQACPVFFFLLLSFVCVCVCVCFFFFFRCLEVIFFLLTWFLFF